jgi:hypothetical protein
MIESEGFNTLGLSVYMIPAWTVILYVMISSILVLMRRIPLYLLTTHLFTVYWFRGSSYDFSVSEPDPW